jgi:hypothetical protein
MKAMKNVKAMKGVTPTAGAASRRKEAGPRT